MLSYERLLAYQAAVKMSQIVAPLIGKIRLHSLTSALQLERALGSVEDNTVEGATASTPGRKANFFRIARDSAGECSGNLRRSHRKGRISDAEWLQARIAIDHMYKLGLDLTVTGRVLCYR